MTNSLDATARLLRVFTPSIKQQAVCMLHARRDTFAQDTTVRPASLCDTWFSRKTDTDYSVTGCCADRGSCCAARVDRRPCHLVLLAECLDARHAGVGMAIFNAVAASVGGFLGPFVVGGLVQRTGSFVSSMVVMGGFLAFAGLMMVGLAVWTFTQARMTRRKIPVARDGSDAVNSRTDLLPSPDDKDVAAVDVELAKRAHLTPTA